MDCWRDAGWGREPEELVLLSTIYRDKTRGFWEVDILEQKRKQVWKLHFLAWDNWQIWMQHRAKGWEATWKVPEKKRTVFQTLVIFRRLGHRGRERGLREQGRWCHIETETHPSPSLADRAVIISHVSSGPDSHLETLYMSHTQYLPPNKNLIRLTDRTRSLKTKRNIVTRKLLKGGEMLGSEESNRC